MDESFRIYLPKEEWNVFIRDNNYDVTPQEYEDYNYIVVFHDFKETLYFWEYRSRKGGWRGVQVFKPEIVLHQINPNYLKEKYG